MNTPEWPALIWNTSRWQGTVCCAEWSGFLACDGLYNMASRGQVSDGTLQLLVKAPNEATEPLPEQKAAFAYLMEHGEAIRDCVLESVFEHYSHWQSQSHYEADEKAEFMPDITEPGHLKILMAPDVLHLLTVAKEGIAYVGLEFGCTWEDEH